jgi:hypothetical protein
MQLDKPEPPKAAAFRSLSGCGSKLERERLSNNPDDLLVEATQLDQACFSFSVLDWKAHAEPPRHIAGTEGI